MKTKLKTKFMELHAIVLQQESTAIPRKSKDDGNTTTAKKTYLDATFADFILALQYRNKTNHPPWPGDVHFMPQADWGGNMGCDDPVFFGKTNNMSLSNAKNQYWIPVEAVHDALEQIHSITGIALNATGFSSQHYVSSHKNDLSQNNNDTSSSVLPSYRDYFDQVLRENHKVSSLPPPTTSSGRVSTPPYEAYFDNATLNQVFCQLYCRDIELYLYSVCLQPWLRSHSVATQQLCLREHERVNIICGESFLQQSTSVHI